jgi:S1-C subfamily serine protease
LEHYIVTDTIPLPGFSGGPLIDAQGRIAGLNTSGFGHGAAITIPSALAWVNAENLAKHGYIKRGYLGIRSQTVALAAEMRSTLGRDQETGLLLVSIEADSPANAGGLIVGDILVGIDGNAIPGHDELMMQMTGLEVGKPVSIEVLRGGKPHTISVTIGEAGKALPHPDRSAE